MAIEDIKRLSSPGAAIVGMIAVTPDDDTDLQSGEGAFPTNILIGSEAALSVIDRFGNIVTFPAGALTPGVFHRISVSRVRDTGTDAALVMVGWDG